MHDKFYSTNLNTSSERMKSTRMVTRVDHELMVQNRDQWLESSGTALASGYHNFVQIKTLRGGNGA